MLAVADEVHEPFWATDAGQVQADLLVSCGDLPFDYLDHLQSVLDVPLVYVPGNHDPDLGGYRRTRSGLVLQAGMPSRHPGPPGGANVDLDVARVAGLHVAGFGGCPAYRDGPNQWTRREERRRARKLRRRARRRPVDILLSHAPPLGVGDREDPAHRGFESLIGLVERLSPQLLLHGHIHPYGEAVPDRRIGETLVANVVGCRMLEVAVAEF